MVDRPVHINRALRDAGLLIVREEDGGELLDPAISKAFAVSDHQIAHVYVADPQLLPRVRAIVAGLPGVERVYDAADKPATGSIIRVPANSSRSRMRGSLVHLLLLARRPPRAGLCAHRRDSPQARLRSGRAVPRSRNLLAETRDRQTAGVAQARIPRPDGRHPAGRVAGSRLPWPRHRPRRTRSFGDIGSTRIAEGRNTRGDRREVAAAGSDFQLTIAHPAKSCRKLFPRS